MRLPLATAATPTCTAITAPISARPLSNSLYINGRFLAQPLSGVQRFATEVTAALVRRAAAAGFPLPILLTPRSSSLAAPPAPALIHPIGRLHGQAWEQLELPSASRDGVLLNLGNTAPLRGRRQAVVIHDAGIFHSPQAYTWQFRTWYRIMQRLLVRGGTRIITVSEFSRSEIIRHLGARPADVDVIVEGGGHMASVVADLTVMGRHRLRPGGFVMVVGNLAAHKNLSGLQAAARDLAVRGYDLVITGGLDRLVFTQQSGPMPTPAKYIGRVADGELRALYEQAACFVFPSFYEGFGLPAVEAMICGCPIVAAAIPALQEVCGDAALYCDPTSPSDIAEKIVQMLEDTMLRERMRERMHERAKRYTWETAAEGLYAVLERL